MNREVRIFSDLDELSRNAAAEISRLISAALERADMCSLALSGGTTPRLLYRLLASEFACRIPWGRLHLFWSDERYVPHDDPSSNYGLARMTLIDRVPVVPSQVHPMPTDLPDAALAAREYEATLRGVFGDLPGFDIVLLGVGSDGHTASLFPGSASVREGRAWVVSADSPVKPHRRLSLTLPVLNSARVIIFLVAGAGKRQIVKSILERSGGESTVYPAAMVRGVEGTLWLLDRAAAGEGQTSDER